MKRKKIIALAAISSFAIAVAAGIGYTIFSKDVITMQDKFEMKKPYSLVMASGWKNTKKPLSDSDHPFGDVDVSNSYENSDKCFVEIANYADDNMNLGSDYDGTFKIAFPNGVPVLSNLSEGNKVNVLDTTSNKYIQMLKAKNEVFVSFFHSYENYDVVLFTRYSSTDEKHFEINIGCPKGSDVNISDLIKEVSIRQN